MSWIQTCSTICFKPYSLEEALRGVAAAGFENVEIGAVKGFLEHLDPDSLGADEIDGTRRLLERYGLRCVSMSGHAPLHQELGRARLRNVLRAGTELGIHVLNTFTGDAESEDERRRFVEGAREFADEARSGKQTLYRWWDSKAAVVLDAFAEHASIAIDAATRRAIEAGDLRLFLVAVFVVMRINGVFQPQIGLFLVALALVAEITLTSGGANRA